MKIIKENNKLILKCSFISHMLGVLVSFCILLFLLSLVFRDIHNVHPFLVFFSIVYFILFLFLISKKELYQCLFDKSIGTITIAHRNVFTTTKNTFSIHNLSELQIDKTSNDEYTQYNLYMIINQTRLNITSCSNSKMVTDTADTIIKYINNPKLKVNPSNIIYDSGINNIDTNKMPVFFKHYNNSDDNSSGVLIDKKIIIVQKDKKLILKVRKTLISLIAFLIILIFFCYFLKDVFTVETIYMNKTNDEGITCTIKTYLLGVEKYEINSIVLNNCKDAKINTNDDGDSTFVIIYENNREYITNNFGENAFTEIKDFIENKNSIILRLREHFNLYDIFWLLIISLLIIIYIFQPYISDIIIDKETSKILIYHRGFRTKKYEEYSINAINNMSYYPSDKKYHLEIELFGKRIELGILPNKEKIDEIIEFFKTR